MAEYSAVAVQDVSSGGNILFTDAPVGGIKCIQHRDGSGIVTLRGLTNQCRARFRVSFNGNVAAVTTAGAVTVAISINGEALGSATMISTVASTGEYSNISASAFIDVPAGCCAYVSVQNLSSQEIAVQNANILVERVA